MVYNCFQYLCPSRWRNLCLLLGKISEWIYFETRNIRRHRAIAARPPITGRPCPFYRGEIISRKNKISYIIITAYVTIGKGEIIVRDNPSQSLDGLNRDPSQALKTEQTTNVNINLDPAFTYVDTILNPDTTTNVLNTLNELSTDPGGFFKRIFTGLFGGTRTKAKIKRKTGLPNRLERRNPQRLNKPCRG